MNTQIKQQNKNILNDVQKLNQQRFINICNEYCVEPYLVLDDLRESNKRWYSITYKELKTFLNERY
jgi:hypothetical protein